MCSSDLMFGAVIIRPLKSRIVGLAFTGKAKNLHSFGVRNGNFHCFKG